MTDDALDIIGIGNAIVDILATADDAFLVRHGLPKGAMTLIDAEQAEKIYGEMGPTVEMSGGSAANTIAGVAALGGRAAFIGRVRDDDLGRQFSHDMRALGVRFENPPADDGLPTARSFILVTPDAQRTMNTFLGASTELGPGDVDPALVQKAGITYLEGYLWDPPEAKKAFRKAMEAAHAAGRKVALTLSDAFCVERYHDEFRALAEHHVDVLFANEAEIKALYRVESFDEALQHVRGHCEIAALTRSEKGSVIVSGDEIHIVDAVPVDRVIDTTGAGDLYAAGFLQGLAEGRDLATSGQMGAIAAAEVISHFGARPETPLRELVQRKLV